MKINVLLCSSCLLITATIAQAGPVLITGTPSNSYNSPAILVPTPNLGGALINFDNLTPSATYSSYTSQGVTITSPDGLVVLPFSTQSGPNEMFDNSADGSANITIGVAQGVDAIGVGIADSDPVTITLQALDSTGSDLGTAFSVTIPEIGSNPGNGYYVIEDTTADIYGLAITQPVGSPNNSGLAIDDVQAAPEPSTVLLLTSGVGILGLFRLRKRA